MLPAILRRIAAQTGMPRLFETLAEDLAPTDLQSLLLAVFRTRGRALRPADAVAQAAQPLLAPARTDARAAHAFDRAAFAAAAEFEAVDVSPVAPLGTSTLLGGIDQNNVLSTIRRAEVLSDNTAALALACAGRRKPPAERPRTLRLCNSHRVIRLQPFDVPDYSPHFRLFALASAGRDTGSLAFECRELRTHVACYLTLLRQLGTEGFLFADPLVEFSDPRITSALLAAVPGALEHVRDHVRAHRPDASATLLRELGVHLPAAIADPATELASVAARPALSGPCFELGLIKSAVADLLAREFPEARFSFNLARLEGLSYYCGPCIRISPLTPDGRRLPLIDGGTLDWTARLLHDRKERFVASGIGTELALARYRRPAS
jgi:hypothetical protein